MEVPTVIPREYFGQHHSGNLGRPRIPTPQLRESRTSTGEGADATALLEQRHALRREPVRATDPETTPSTHAAAAASSSTEIGPSSRSDSAR